MNSMKAVVADPSNAEALKAWDGPDGDYWAQNEHIFDRALEPYGPVFFKAAAITETDKVLDIGCGNGRTTREAARRASSGSALGIDLSSQMLAVASRRATEEGLRNVRFEQGDAQIYPFEAGSFDVATSRAGAMFFGDPVAAFTNIARALRPDGRLALLVWQSLGENEWLREIAQALSAGRQLPGPPPGAPGPLSLSEPERVNDVLSAAGFADITLDAAAEPMYFGRHADDAYRFITGLGFTSFMLKDLSEDAQAAALADLRGVIEDRETPDGVLFKSGAWIIVARRI